MQKQYYKFLAGNRSCNGGDYTWSLPTKNDDGTWTPGEWTDPVEGDLAECENAYHVCEPRDVLRWLGPDMYVVDIDPDNRRASDDKKTITRRARLTRKVETWDDRTARLFAVLCARQALSRINDPDPRSVAACDVAERYANGEATEEDLAAAWDAAWAAAWAAWDAARAARAARAAASAAAWAASAAAWAAWAAAWAAVWDAAWDAAMAATWPAWDAAWAAQIKHLFEMLEIELEIELDDEELSPG